MPRLLLSRNVEDGNGRAGYDTTGMVAGLVRMHAHGSGWGLAVFGQGLVRRA
jgi:hypothetical protein|eukprot:COSAG01_NODE_2297_length_7966_cov_145.938604_10_plen_52_part_00